MSGRAGAISVPVVPEPPEPAGDPRSDGELLAAHASGDHRAFEELFRRHRVRLYRLARHRTRTAEDADDALQEAMLSAHRAASSFRRDAAVGSWLHRIVVNACLDRLRRDAGRPAGPMTTAVASDPTGLVDTALVIRAALAKLPAAQRAAVIAVDMHGYSVAEAARLLGVAEGTVKSRRARARTRLALLLGPGAR